VNVYIYQVVLWHSCGCNRLCRCTVKLSVSNGNVPLVSTVSYVTVSTGASRLLGRATSPWHTVALPLMQCYFWPTALFRNCPGCYLLTLDYPVDPVLLNLFLFVCRFFVTVFTFCVCTLVAAQFDLTPSSDCGKN